jgi:hypothetical protein
MRHTTEHRRREHPNQNEVLRFDAANDGNRDGNLDRREPTSTPARYAV